MRRWPSLLLLAACGDAIVATGSGVSDTVGPSLGSTAPVEVTEPCATAAIGAACTNAPDECELGEGAALGCNARVACNGFRWVRAASAADCGTCPPSADGGAADGICEYTNDRRTCALVAVDRDAGADADTIVDAESLADAGSLADAAVDAETADADAGADSGEPDSGDARIWTCIDAPEGCPRVRPHVGLRCVVPMTCDYGACVLPGGHAMECVGEFWHVASVRCTSASSKNEDP